VAWRTRGQPVRDFSRSNPLEEAPQSLLFFAAYVHVCDSRDIATQHRRALETFAAAERLHKVGEVIMDIKKSALIILAAAAAFTSAACAVAAVARFEEDAAVPSAI
jgi:hypothetical protein